MKFIDLIKTNNKKLIIVDSKSNFNKIVKNYCIKTGMPISNIKAITVKDLATQIFMATGGVDNTFRIVGDSISQIAIEYCLRNQDEDSNGNIYGFIPKKAIYLRTPIELLKALNQIRFGLVKNKNYKYECLMNLNEDYKKVLKAVNYIDYSELLDNAIAYLKNVSGDEIKSILSFGPNLSVYMIDYLDTTLTYKEKMFLKYIVSAYGSGYELVSYLDEDISSDVKEHYVKAYGQFNEVDYILEKMKKDKIKSGDINIYYTDDVYENIIRAKFENAGVKYALKNAHASSTNLIELFLDIIKFYQDDMLYEDLYDVCKNPIFKLADDVKPVSAFTNVLRANICNTKDRYRAYIDDISKRPSDNKYPAFVSFLSDLCSAYDPSMDVDMVFTSLYKLVIKYIYKNNEYLSLIPQFDDVDVILKIMSPLRDEEFDKLDYIKNIISNLTYSDLDETDSVYVSKLSGVSVLDRGVSFIIGLSASQVKIKEIESAIFTDDEYIDMLDTGDGDYYIELSSNANIEFDNTLRRTLNSQMYGDIYYEYMEYNTIEFKPSSPSVFYIEKAHDEETHSYKYDENERKANIDIVRKYVLDNESCLDSDNINNIGTTEVADYVNDLNIETEEVKIIKFEDKKEDKWSMSASALGVLVECPMCYIYHYVKHLPNIEFKSLESYKWLDPLAKGHLFHRTLELYSNETYLKYKTTDLKFAEDILEAVYEEAIKEAVAEIPYPSEAAFLSDKKYVYNLVLTYIKGLQNFYDSEKEKGHNYLNIGNEVEFGEGMNYKKFPVIYKDEVSLDINGKTYNEKYEIAFYGSIDRLDAYVSGDVIHFKIIDYKTSKKESLKGEISKNTKIQHYIYAYAVREYFYNNKNDLEKLFGHEIKSYKIDEMEYALVSTNEKLLWSRKFENKNIAILPESFEELLLPDQVREALGYVALAKRGVNIDTIYSKMNGYYTNYGIKDANKYSNYKHICRYEIDNEVEDDDVEDSSGE